MMHCAMSAYRYCIIYSRPSVKNKIEFAKFMPTNLVLKQVPIPVVHKQWKITKLHNVYRRQVGHLG